MKTNAAEKQNEIDPSHLSVIKVTDSKLIAELRNQSSIGVHNFTGLAYEHSYKHPEVLKCEPDSRYGLPYFSKIDDTNYFVWITPVAGGLWESTDDFFIIENVTLGDIQLIDKSLIQNANYENGVLKVSIGDKNYQFHGVEASEAIGSVT